jgi:hypothetical protein
MLTEQKITINNESTKTKHFPHLIKISKKYLPEDFIPILITEESDNKKKTKSQIKYPVLVDYDDYFLENLSFKSFNSLDDSVGLIPKCFLIEFWDLENNSNFKSKIWKNMEKVFYQNFVKKNYYINNNNEKEKDKEKEKILNNNEKDKEKINNNNEKEKIIENNSNEKNIENIESVPKKKRLSIFKGIFN